MRPSGITLTAVAMSSTNALGWLMIDPHAEQANVRFITYSTAILVGYVFVWFYWQGHNWARIAVILCSALAVVNLLDWNSTKPGTIVWWRHAMIASEAALGLFLLYWLNTAPVRRWFRNKDETAS
jgi:hypothetical protein